MQELFDDKPWMQPLAVAGSHLGETENEIDMQDEEENIPDKSNITSYIISLAQGNREQKQTNHS